MKIPVIWLNDYVKVSDITPEELAEKLVSIGFEVEEILYAGEGIQGVITGRVETKVKHADADKLSVCTVNLGSETVTIVTGATNVQVGDVVPVATDGAGLPGGKQIHAAPLRGVMSYGMLCSGAELHIDDAVIKGAEVQGILILPPKTPIGKDIKEVLGLDEYVLDVSVTANRPDCQSVYGMAREVGAVLGRKVKALDLSYKTVAAKTGIPQAVIDAPSICAKYSGRKIENISISSSPNWMQLRLRLAGIRPINNLVDITNYVLLEVGQPLHAFDSRFVQGDIHVRPAKDGESIVALDGKNYALQEDMLVIADEAKPIAIAGVMGGENSGIMPDTKEVFLEAATFARGSVRATSRTLGLRSDSSARYERGVGLWSVEIGRERALHLIDLLEAGVVTDCVTEAGSAKEKEATIVTSAQQISALLGISVQKKKIVKILQSLGFEVQTQDSKDELVCTVPAFRTDVDNYTDLAEEVIRFYGYDNIESTLMTCARPTVGGRDAEHENIERLKDLMCGYGAYEILTYGFIHKRQYDWLRVPKDDVLRMAIPILNPLSEEYGYMRTQLIGSMLKTVYTNTNRKNTDFRLFEIARTFHPNALPLTELPQEKQTLCISAVGKSESFYDLKEIVAHILRLYDVSFTLQYSKKSWLHPGISADIYSDAVCIGSFGKIHPRVLENYDINVDVYAAELDLSGFINKPLSVRIYDPLPKFPAIQRDVALVIAEKYTVGDLTDMVRKAAGDLLENVKLFDIYRGEQVETGHKSVALTLTFRAKDRTLGDAEVQKEMDTILNAAKVNFNAVLRS